MYRLFALLSLFSSSFNLQHSDLERQALKSAVDALIWATAHMPVTVVVNFKFKSFVDYAVNLIIFF